MPFDFRVLAEALPQIVWSCNADGTHDYFNARWQEFTGCSVDGGPDVWKRLVHPQDRQRVFATWQQCLITGNPYDIDYRFQGADAEFRWLWVMARAHLDHRGQILRWFGTSTDIHDTTLASYERERTAQALRILAEIDDLTGLLNRRTFSERATALLAQHRSAPVSVLMIDVDNFKSINDAHGHRAGDAVLRDIALRVSRALPADSLLARIGGDEFIALICPADTQTIRRLVGRLRINVADSPVIGTAAEAKHICVTVSIGGSTHTTDTELATLIDTADKALYKAKAGGRNRYEDTP